MNKTNIDYLNISLADLIKHYRNGDTLFCTVLQKYLSDPLNTKQQLVEAVQTSNSSFDKWISGETIPSQGMQIFVIRWLEARL